MTIPRIGLSLDSESPGGYSKYPWYALRQNYCDALAAQGGLPLPLPHHPDLAESYLDQLDGLVITGGAFDVDPALFGATARHATVTTKDRRTAFELAVVRGALARNLPILGICGGEQLLAVALGGTLIQHIPDSYPDSPIAHEQPNPRHEPGHSVTITPGSQLAAIIGSASIAVNSAHHQAVASVPPEIVINARAPDGVIEGIEDPSRRFCLGVQWHPEFILSAADAAVLTAFIEACQP